MAFSISWNSAFEASPPDTEDARLVGLRIRDLKTAIRQRLDPAGQFGSVGDLRYPTVHYGDGTARAALPAGDLYDGIVFFRTDLGVYDLRSGGVWLGQRGQGYGTLVQRDALDTAKIPIGYIWLEYDSGGKMTYWDGGSWKTIAGSGAGLTDFVSSATEGIITTALTVLKAGAVDMVASVTVPAAGDWGVKVNCEVCFGNNGTASRGGVQIEQKVGAGAFAALGNPAYKTIGANVGSYSWTTPISWWSDTPLTNSTVYQYRIAARTDTNNDIHFNRRNISVETGIGHWSTMLVELFPV